MKCDLCEGKGRIEITFWEARLARPNNPDQAGELHHYEICEKCGGTGKVADAEEK